MLIALLIDAEKQENVNENMLLINVVQRFTLSQSSYNADTYIMTSTLVIYCRLVGISV
jgi:hypothetical protein